jgi:hypothetical protein
MVFEIEYPLHVAPEPGYEDVVCILDAKERLVAAMMHPEHAAEAVAVLNRESDPEFLPGACVHG